ncbi:peptidylprolyl isomerase [Aeromonas cavernicola]|uniref:Peptidyl-prolyl cis-trans isomerase n=1 Tax=Aeromonas cavernicola TaxID=1006623 RepID=A0A2H9U4Q3_9GAMM|nr:peptidylprolyl isomerase [Aeromonas cavernicola]PJG58959.1 peptidylprolyl isomerase [Aeromonas cavernicola]
MKKWWFVAMLFAPLALAAPRVQMETNHGNIVIELAPKQAPQTVKNFLRYVADGSYDGSVFHRVIRNFVVQGGGYNQQFQQLPTFEPVINESKGGLPNKRGTIAMARTQAVDSATRQFYFNLVDNNNLNASGGAGYTVFGEVVQGMNVLDKLAQVQTSYSSILRAKDVPTSPIILKKVVLLADSTAEKKTTP